MASGQDASAPLLPRILIIRSAQLPTAYRTSLLVGSQGPDAAIVRGIQGQEMVMNRMGASVDIEGGSTEMIVHEVRSVAIASVRIAGSVATARAIASPSGTGGTLLLARVTVMMSLRRTPTTTAQRFQGQHPLPSGRLADLVHQPASIVGFAASALPHQRKSAATENLRLAEWHPRPGGRLATALQLPGSSAPVLTTVARTFRGMARSAGAMSAVGTTDPSVPRSRGAAENVLRTITTQARSFHGIPAATVRRFQGQQPLPHGRLADLVHLPARAAGIAVSTLPHQRKSEATEDPRLAWWQPRPGGRLATAWQLPGPSASVLAEQPRVPRGTPKSANVASGLGAEGTSTP